MLRDDQNFKDSFTVFCNLKVTTLLTTSFQRQKWPQTKMHTNFDIIFGHSALSHGVIYFVPRVSSKNLEMEVSDWLLKNFNQ